MGSSKLEFSKKLQIFSCVLSGMVFGGTDPIVHIYMMQSIGDDFYKMITFIQEVVTLFIFVYVDKRDKNGESKALKHVRRYFIPIIVMGEILFIGANALSLIDTRIRFLMLASIQAITMHLWIVGIDDIWNREISGSDLTLWNTKCTKFEMLGSMIGVSLIQFIPIDIEMGLLIQCIGYFLLGVIDYKIYKNLVC